jgi:hypothetical protein
MARKTVVIGGSIVILLLLGIGGAVAMLGVAFTDVQRLSLGETSYEQSDLVVQTATPVGPGNTVDQIELVVDNADVAPINATAQVWLLSDSTEVTTGTLTETFTPGQTTVSVVLDDRTRMAVYDSLDIRLTEN